MESLLPRGAVIYQIFVDRFALSTDTETTAISKEVDIPPEFIGGNLEGVIQRFDYLKELGVDVLWLTPINETSAYHGYHITDFFTIDPRFGSEATLRELCELCHANGMQVMLDFVPNHCSYRHPFFLEAQEDPNSRYRDWFTFREWPNNYVCFLEFPELPKLNLEHPDARRHVIDAAKHWLDVGVDGYRLDHCIGPSHDFWRQFVRELKAHKPSCYLIGEAWFNAAMVEKHCLPTILMPNTKLYYYLNKFVLQWLGLSDWTMTLSMREYVGVLDGVLDFGVHSLINKHIIHDQEAGNRTGWLAWAQSKLGMSPTASRDALRVSLAFHRFLFPSNFYLPGFLDNHDLNRVMFEANDDAERVKAAARFLFLEVLDQPVVLYYGTEVGMSQRNTIWDRPYGDVEARRLMRFPSAAEDSYPGVDDVTVQANEMLAFFKELIRQRKLLVQYEQDQNRKHQ